MEVKCERRGILGNVGGKNEWQVREMSGPKLPPFSPLHCASLFALNEAPPL